MSLGGRRGRGRLLAALLAAIFLVWAPASPAARLPYEGVQLHSLWSGVSAGELRRELALADETGSNAVRVDVGWSSLEQYGKRRWNPWYRAKLDRFVTGAAARGMKVIVTLWSTPCWASTAPEDLRQGCRGAWWDRGVHRYAPRRASDYGDIARWLTARYGSRLAAVEVWNEPTLDSTRFWIAPDRASAYVGLLRAAYPAVKAADPSVEVLATLNGCDEAFLTAIYDRGARGHYDGLGVHPYGEEPGYCDPVRDLQRRRGDNAPLWITEFGWATGQGHEGAVTYARQAALITQTFAGARSRRWIRAAILYELRDRGGDVRDPEDNWGLLRSDYAPKPSYTALTVFFTGRPPWHRFRSRLSRTRSPGPGSLRAVLAPDLASLPYTG